MEPTAKQLTRYETGREAGFLEPLLERYCDPFHGHSESGRCCAGRLDTSEPAGGRRGGRGLDRSALRTPPQQAARSRGQGTGNQGLREHERPVP